LLDRPGGYARGQASSGSEPFHAESVTGKQGRKRLCRKEVQVVEYGASPYFPEKPGLKTRDIRRGDKKAAVFFEDAVRFPYQNIGTVKVFDEVGGKYRSRP
jgi:hypothetical protein